MYSKFIPTITKNIRPTSNRNKGNPFLNQSYLELIELDEWKNVQTDVKVPLRIEKNNERNKSYLDIIPCAIITCNSQSKIINANSEAEELFQYKLNEIQDQSFYQLLSAESGNELQRIISEEYKENQFVKNVSVFIKGRKLGGIEIDLKANIIMDRNVDEIVIILYEKDSSLLNKNLCINPLKESDNSNNLWKAFKISNRKVPATNKIDIPFRKEYIQNNLKDHEVKNTVSVETRLPEIEFGILFLLDNEYRIKSVSSSIVKFLGYSKDELYNTNFTSKILSGDVIGFNKFLELVKHTKKGDSQIEINLLNRNGEYIPFEIKGNCTTGESLFIFCYEISHWKKKECELIVSNFETNKLYGQKINEFTDLNKNLLQEIEWRKEAEKDLRIKEERLELANEVIDLGFWDYNFISRKIYCNNNFNSILELEDKVFSSFSFKDLEKMVYNSDRNLFINTFKNHIAMLTPVFEIEHRIITKKNNLKWILTRGKIVQRDEDDNPLRFIGSLEDISLRKIYEEKMQSELIKENKLNELQTGFVSMLSHQIRNPLSQILSSSEILEMFINDIPENERLEIIKKIQRSVDKLTETLNDASNIDDQEGLNKEINIAEFDVVKLFEKLIDKIKTQYDDSALIHFEPEHDKLLIKSNAEAIEQIFVNLLSNSIKFSKKSKNISVVIKVINKSFIINISDEGTGIDYADQPKIFKPFFKGKNSENTDGSGLGLTLVKRAVESLNGSIEFKSHPGAGTNFIVTIPIK